MVQLTPQLDAMVIVARDLALEGHRQRIGLIVALYQQMLDTLKPATTRLQRLIDNSSKIDLSDIRVTAIYQSLRSEIESQLRAFISQAMAIAVRGRRQVVRVAEQTSRALIGTSLSVSGNGSASDVSLNTPAGLLSAAAAIPLLGGGSFANWANSLLPAAMTAAIASVDRAIEAPRTPVVIDDAVRAGLSIVQNRSASLVRTEPINTARYASLAIYAENPDLVHGWIFWANPEACPVCVGRHGEFHMLAEPFDSHPNCGCWPVPETQDPATGELTNAPWTYERGNTSDAYLAHARETLVSFSAPFKGAA